MTSSLQTIWATWWMPWACSPPAPCSRSSPSWGPSQTNTDRQPSCCPAGWPPPSPPSAASTTDREEEGAESVGTGKGLGTLRHLWWIFGSLQSNEEQSNFSFTLFTCYSTLSLKFQRDHSHTKLSWWQHKDYLVQRVMHLGVHAIKTIKEVQTLSHTG